ncbi:hypothetical protein TSAR_003300 [Trichomalopsis sarcophagae]|uniref:Uncharacterized protein n=1 Tax=Trichomalopsis sarcophagae TaxID=543379 RepID=A0A232EFA1_9HYME|nr:hypothetical protein TSAR_003300 [Trichomalopsis sarcophagae]
MKKPRETTQEDYDRLPVMHGCLFFSKKCRKSNVLTKNLNRVNFLLQIEEHHKEKYFHHKQGPKVCLSCYMTEAPRIRGTITIQYIVKYDNLTYDCYKCKASTIIYEASSNNEFEYIKVQSTNGKRYIQKRN